MIPPSPGLGRYAIRSPSNATMIQSSLWNITSNCKNGIRTDCLILPRLRQRKSLLHDPNMCVVPQVFNHLLNRRLEYGAVDVHCLNDNGGFKP